MLYSLCREGKRGSVFGSLFSSLLLVVLILAIGSCGNVYSELADLNKREVDLFVSSFGTTGVSADVLSPEGTFREDFALEVNGFIRTVQRLGNGSLFIGGDFTQVNGVSVNGAASINRETGALEPGHRLDLILGGANPGYILGSALLEDGGLVIVGNWDSVNGIAETPDIARLNPDGSVDTSFVFGAFDTVGTFPNQEVRSVIYAGGRVYVSGFFNAVGTVSGSKIEADKFFSFRPEDSLGSLNPPAVPDGPTDVADSFVPTPDGGVIALGNFEVTFESAGAIVTLQNGVLLRGEEPTAELVMDLPNVGNDFWAGEWVPGVGLLVTGPISVGGDAVEPWLVWYDTNLAPTFEMPLRLDGVGIPFFIANDYLLVHGNFTTSSDIDQTAGPGALLRMSAGFQIDPTYAPPLEAGSTAVLVHPLF